MNIVQRARQLRAKMETTAAQWPDETALDFKEFFPQWAVGKTYAIGDRVRDDGALYKCIQGHTAQSDWKPSITGNLWREVTLDEWPEWVQPIGSSDTYSKGDKVSHNGKHWISDVDHNSWEPGVYGWTEQ